MNDQLTPLLTICGLLGAIFSFVFVLVFVRDKKLHRGLSWFDRRRIRATGVRASASIVSETSFRAAGDLEFDFVVQVKPPSGQPFRALVATDLGIHQISWFHVGDEVPVYYDAQHSKVVIFDMPAMAKIVALRRRKDDVAARERQERLLRGDE